MSALVMKNRAPTAVHVLGTGKMAKDIGLFLWTKGFAVTWVSREQRYLDDLRRLVTKQRHKWRAITDPQTLQEEVAFARIGDEAMSRPEIILETTVETPAIKRAVIDAAAQDCHPEPLLLSNSSSILPNEIHPDAMGMHFFFPVAFTGLAELIVPASATPERVSRAARFADSLGVTLIRQNAETAFALNRLLLVPMAEGFRALAIGVPPASVDAWSRSPLFPIGIVQLMDSIGYDVLLSATRRFRLQMAPNVAVSFRHLEACLTELVSRDILGKKNRRDLRRSLPCALPESPAAGLRFDEKLLNDVFINTCFVFAETGHIRIQDLETALRALFGTEVSPEEALTLAGVDTVHTRLLTLYRESGISYFRPSRRVSDRYRRESWRDREPS